MFRIPRNIRFGEGKLLIGFAILILLMVVIGLAGIWKIQSLSIIIDDLGKRNLVIEKSVLEMKINNTLYAMAVRNFVLWQTSKYLGAVSTAARLDVINQAMENFDQQLKNYADYIQTPLARQWLQRLSGSVQELRNLGERIISLVKNQANTQEVNRLSLIFENNFYKINEFLDGTLSLANLKEIDQQIRLGYIRRKQATLLLSWALILGLIIGTTTAGWIYLRRKQERKRKEEMFRQIITLEERERQNISVQIHDQMAQDLSALKIYTGVVEQAVVQKGEIPELKDKVEQMKRILSGLIDRTHNLCLLLRPPELDELGLVDSIGALVLEYKRLTGINYVYQKPEAEIKLPPESSLFLYRLAQEALTNTAKHAQAKNVIIRLGQDKRRAEFSFEDDGIGFDQHKVINRPRRRREDKLKLGLLGLQERAELLDGRMHIDSSPGKGTRISVQLNC